MKSTLALLLITASFTAFAQNPPAITPESRDRFLNGVNDFAGGKTTPGATRDDPPPLTTRPGSTASTGTSTSSTASWRSTDGRVNGGSIANPTLQGQTISPQQIQVPVVQSPWTPTLTK